MKKIAFIAAAAALAFSAQAMAQDYTKITIATEGAYKPWNFKDAAGNLVGFEIDLANDLCARMNVDCTIVEQAWESIIPSLETKKFDAIMAGMSITDERMKKITFSRAYTQNPAVFVVTKDSPSANLNVSVSSIELPELDANESKALEGVLAEFSGKIIGVQTSTTHENFLNEYLKGKAEVRSYDTQENLDLDLQAGRVDAALASYAYWKPLLDSDKGKEFKMVGPGFLGGPFGFGVGVGTRKDDQALADKFSAAINEALKDGTVSRLSVQWFEGLDIAAKN